MFELTRLAMVDRRNHHDRPRRQRRVGMWLVLAVNGLFAWWLVATLVGWADDPAGSTLASLVIFVLWALADVVCGVLYLVTRPRR